MPSASYSPPRVIEDLDDATQILRAGGHRVSASRRLTLEGLLAAEGPVSAEYLASGLGGRTPAGDLPSAYRNLELFERLGLVTHVHIGHGPGLYALVSDSEHAYAVCERCGRLTKLGPEDIEDIRSRVRGATGFEAHFSHFPILGLCRECSGGDARGPSAESGHEHSHGDRVHSHPHGHSHEH
jgi:Fur family ferric uptake transcriptional regulator